MKHTHKRIMSIFAAATLSVCSLPQGTPLLLRPAVIASAADSGTCGENLTWTLDSSGKLTISGTGSMDNWTYERDAPWHAYRADITKLVIENGVTSIGGNAFSSCTNLPEIELPESVHTIGAYAFQRCSKLTNVMIPWNVTSIEAWAFCECSNLESITIMNYNCTITANSQTICNEVIDDYTQNDRSPFRGTIYGYSGSTADKYAHYAIFSKPFSALAKPTSGSWDDNISWEYQNGTLKVSGNGDIQDAKHGGPMWSIYQDEAENIVIADGITGIGADVFKRFEKITDLILPDSVTKIGDNSYESCSGLKTAVIPKNANQIGNYAFFDCSSLESVTIPKNVTSIGNAAFNRCNNLKIKGYEESLAESYAKQNNIPFEAIGTENIEPQNGICGDKLTWDLKDGVLTISGDGAMYDYSAENKPAFAGADFSEVVFSGAITSIGKYAFIGCTALKSINVPDTVTSIGSNAFEACSGLASVSIPDSVTSISEFAFFNCSSLTDISLPQGITSINGGMLNCCSALESITIPQRVTSIGAVAFNCCESLKSVTIPESVKSIDYGAFYGCTDMTSIIIPESVTEIGEEVFLDCGKLTIKGYQGSAAEKYAKENSIPFEAITLTTTTVTTTAAATTTTTTKATTSTTAKPTTTTTTSTTAKSTTTTTTSTTPKPTTTVTTSTTPKPTATTVKVTTTTAKVTTTTAMATTTTAKATTTAAPVTTTIPTETIPIVTTSAAPAPVRGDVTGDGEVSVDDAQLTLKAYTERIAGNDMKLTAEQIKAADVNGDGEISVDDAQNILKYYTEKSVAGKDITWDDIFGKKTQSLPRLIRKRISSFIKN